MSPPTAHPPKATPTDSERITEEQYWEERIRRMTQMSRDVSAGLYDDVLDPMREAVVTLITSQMPHGYAYDYNECCIVRFDPNLPDTFTIKSEAGNNLPVPAPTVLDPADLETDPERYETRTRPMPSPTEEQYWEERIRRMTQMSQDVDDGLNDDMLIPMAEATISLITSHMPNGYAYDLNKCRVVRLDPNLPDAFTIKDEAGNDLPIPAPTIIHPTEMEADPERYETRTRPIPAPTEEQYWEERIRRMTQMSQDVDDGLYDDVLDPLREAADRLITDQLPDGYAYDLDECQVVRLDSNLPGTFTIKDKTGNDLPILAPAIIHPTALQADPERYETRT